MRWRTTPACLSKDGFKNDQAIHHLEFAINECEAAFWPQNLLGEGEVIIGLDSSISGTGG